MFVGLAGSRSHDVLSLTNSVVSSALVAEREVEIWAEMEGHRNVHTGERE